MQYHTYLFTHLLTLLNPHSFLSGVGGGGFTEYGMRGMGGGGGLGGAGGVRSAELGVLGGHLSVMRMGNNHHTMKRKPPPTLFIHSFYSMPSNPIPPTNQPTKQK